MSRDKRAKGAGPLAKRANGGGTIHDDPQRRRWIGRVTVALDERGRPVRRKIVARTGAEATRRIRELRDAAHEGRESLRADVTVGRWSPHELRHSAGSLLLAQGVPLEVVSETLGHSSIRITKDVYGHLLDGQRAQAAHAMEAALWGTS